MGIPKLIPLYGEKGKSQNPMGFPMCQNRMSPMVWAYAMEMLPPSKIVEIGSLNGGFTTVLGMIAYLSKCQIYSFDICKAPNEDWLALSAVFGINFIKADVFQFPNLIESLVQRPGTSFLLCDGGNKTREFNTFAGSLKTGDIIAAHDYRHEEYWPWSEIKLADVEQTVKRFGLKPYMQDHFDMVGWLVFQKVP